MSNYSSDFRIMLVDDEPFNIKSMMVILKLSLKSMGLDPSIIDDITDFAYNGQEAVQLVKTSIETKKEYAIIFMDCSMPIMDGYQASMKIKKFAQMNNIV
jgi:two-component system sensor histidine kinase/response regulator